jgi:hypothetical protein
MTTYLGMEQGISVDASSLTVTMPPAAQNGDTVFVHMWRSGTSQWGNVTKPSGWTSLITNFESKLLEVRTFAVSPNATYTWTLPSGTYDVWIWRAVAYRNWRGDIGSFTATDDLWDNGLVVGSSFGDYKDLGETGWFTGANSSFGISTPNVEFRRDYVLSAIDRANSDTSQPVGFSHSMIGAGWNLRQQTAFYLLPSQSVLGNYETYTFSTWDKLDHDMEGFPRFITYTSNTVLSESTALGNWYTQPLTTADLKTGTDHWTWAEPTGDTWR